MANMFLAQQACIKRSITSSWLLRIGHVLLIALAGCAIRSPDPSTTAPVLRKVRNDVTLIPLTSSEGMRLLERATYSGDFIRLSQTFVTQDNLAFCGVASSVMVLNALSIDKPVSEPHGSYTIFNQDNYFTTASNVIRPRSDVENAGMSLKQLAGLLRVHGIEADPIYANTVSLNEFKAAARSVLNDADSYLLVNYKRAEIGQQHGGHISPIAAYCESTDQFLIFDVARYKYPSVWVDAEDLWRAMVNVDSDSSRSRGYVLVHYDPSK